MLKTTFVFLAAVLACGAFDLNEFTVNPKIVQGSDASHGQFPYYVLLKVNFPQGIGACGGSLISDEWVVTAAHCLNKASAVEVHLGSLKAKEVNEEGRIILKADKKNLFIHPRYFEAVVLNDIGLIKLPQKVTFSDTIQPVKLACNSTKGIGVTAIGNGLTSTDSKELAPILQYAALTTISFTECLIDFPFLLFRKSVICARGIQQRSTCRGDSGGPIVDSSQALIGLTSFGSAKGCHLGYPQGFTNIPSYLQWIKQTTGVSECVKDF